MKHIPRKRFGQNFLTDQTVLHEIIRAIDPRPNDVMVEIGPGLAAMTRLLLESLERLHVVELDRDLVARLKKNFDPQRLIVHEGDALQFDFASLVPTDGVKLRVVGLTTFPVRCCSTSRRSPHRCTTSISCCKRKWSNAWWLNPEARSMDACP
jgi:16S rRNA A1518/A1519 N6-dimethyltransferase RsmA/KsgA/DIM1 with predicted DNA glycosylase/AP lyase activity